MALDDRTKTVHRAGLSSRIMSAFAGFFLGFSALCAHAQAPAESEDAADATANAEASPSPGANEGPEVDVSDAGNEGPEAHDEGTEAHDDGSETHGDGSETHGDSSETHADGAPGAEGDAANVGSDERYPDSTDRSSAEPAPDEANAHYPDSSHGRSPAERYPSEAAGREVGVRYFLERIDVRGQEPGTRASVIRSYVHLEPGDVVDPADPLLERIEWRLRGTGWFSSVRVRLERAERRGWVVLVVEVEGQNTIAVEGLTFGFSEGVNTSLDTSSDLIFYAGATIAETNLFGTGARLALSGLGSTRGRAVRLDYSVPRLLPANLALRASFYYANAREFFGNDPLVSVSCPEDIPDCEPRNAVVFYRRGYLSVGTSRDIGRNVNLTVDWRGELVSVRSIPDSASEDRGGVIRPINFGILRGQSFVSSLQLKLTFDRRNDPVVTTQGTFFRGSVDLAQAAFGSDYDFARLQLQLRQWVPLHRNHSLRFGAFAGAIFGEAPFFYKFHVADFTGFVPSRYLDVQLDRRQSPDFFGNAISVMRQQELAARVDVQYEATLFRGSRNLRTLIGYVNVGLITLGDRRDLQVGFPGFQGAAQFPLDLTVDLGLRFDASFGVFEIGFSNILGFVSL